MERWKQIQLSKEEEEGIIVETDETSEEETFQRTLVGKLWTESTFNTRAFKSTMVNAWKLKNPVEIQDLSKNLFLFKFSTKRDMEYILRSDAWSFDKSLLVLARVSGEEQPFDLTMHFETFWVRIYELPLMLRPEAMAKKMRDILGSFEEMDMKDAHPIDRFLRIKVTIDLRNPLKRGTVVKFKEKSLRVHFKYERLPTFCFVCRRIGHQLKDYKALEDLNEEGFEDIEEQELSYGQSRCETKEKEKEGERDQEVQQTKKKVILSEQRVVVSQDGGGGNIEVEKVAESLGAMDISLDKQNGSSNPGTIEVQKKKWTRKKGQSRKISKEIKGLGSSKIQLIDVMIVDRGIEDCGSGEKKRKQGSSLEAGDDKIPEVVFEIQHRLRQ
ncbi:unnamed protein product [Vicia faba]|uniref:DUF4283 domain-containing protein n=1 Tax=Vicia faba TaxID=3906 RepID=A0AAV1A848_VICFA|nr:unnamed protein product [Vicia faba]